MAGDPVAAGKNHMTAVVWSLRMVLEDGMPEVITRKEAIARGLKRYFTGSPCKNGHLAERRADNGQCLKCQTVHEKARNINPAAKALRNAAQAKRRKTDQGRLKRREEYAAYRKRNRQRLRVSHRRHYQRHREKKLKKVKEYQSRPEVKKRKSEYKQRVSDLIAVLRAEMPDLLKEFDL
jgi:hypothetical protein